MPFWLALARRTSPSALLPPPPPPRCECRDACSNGTLSCAALDWMVPLLCTHQMAALSTTPSCSTGMSASHLAVAFDTIICYATCHEPSGGQQPGCSTFTSTHRFKKQMCSLSRSVPGLDRLAEGHAAWPASPLQPCGCIRENCAAMCNTICRLYLVSTTCRR